MAAQISKNTVFLQSEVQLRLWEAQVSVLTEGRKRARPPGGGRKCKHSAEDGYLLIRFRGERKEQRCVTPSQLLQKAQEFQPLINLSWMERWRGRHGVSLRRVARKTMLTGEQVKSRCQDFHTFLFYWTNGGAMPFDTIINVDEIPDSIAGKMTGGCTYDWKGTSKVIAKESADDFKRCITFVAAVAVSRNNDGTYTKMKVAPVVIHRTTVKGHANSAGGCRGALVVKNETGVVNSRLMIETIVPHLLSVAAGRTLLVLDSAKCHVNHVAIDAIKARGAVPCAITGGMTQFLQYIDTNFAARYRCARHEDYLSTARPKTAMAQRDFVVESTARRYNKIVYESDVVRHFSDLGYTQLGSLNVTLEGYAFVAPALPSQAPPMHPAATKPAPPTPKELFARVAARAAESSSQSAA